MLPDVIRFQRALLLLQRRLRVASLASTLVAASALACLLTVGLSLTNASVRAIQAVGVSGFLLAVIALGALAWRRWTTARAAAAVESRVPGLDNLVVTAEEVMRSPRPVHALVRDALFADATARLETASPHAVRPLMGPVAMAALAVLASVLVLATVPHPPGVRNPYSLARTTASDAPLEVGDLRVIVTPPSYTGRSVMASLNPTDLSVLEGSRIRLETKAEEGGVQVISPGREPVPFVLANDRWAHEFGATESRVLLIQQLNADRRDGDRLLQLRVESDQRPVVRIRAPAKDLIFGEPKGHVSIEIEARDDIALASLVLRYTRVAGSGETFTFEEGERSVRIEPTAVGEWSATGTLVLDSLKLADGDTLVYRAVATDRKPGADPGASETYLVEIGRRAGVASTGFAIPEERDRQALSQQMLIIKTERLHGTRWSLSSEAFEEQSRLLAVEQRMVKAEFVFMTGGEVADEVEEAEHAHELAEGRFENAAQVELLTAIREMSRAEARLNAADTTQALVFERNALAALQRAFDRRRYLLRTLPERARIDAARRLMGDRAGARPAPRSTTDLPQDPSLERVRQVMSELGAAIAARAKLDATLASKILAVDPSSEALQKTVAALVSSRDVEARLVAAREAQRHLTDILRGRLAATPRADIPADPLSGRLADAATRIRR